jgi:hypothetical protein
LTNWLLQNGSKLSHILKNLATNGKLDIIRKYHWHYQDRWIVDTYVNVAHFSAINGHLLIIKWVYHTLQNPSEISIISVADWNTKCLQLDSQLYHIAVEYSQLDIIRWIHEQSSTCLLSEELCKIAVQNGNIDVIKLLHLQHPEYDWVEDEYIEIAVNDGHLEVLKWVYDQYYISSLYYDLSDEIEPAVRNGKLEVLKWLYSEIPNHDLSNKRYISLAVRYGHLEVLKWIMHYHHKFDWSQNYDDSDYEDDDDELPAHWSYISLAVYNDRLEVLKWLYSQTPAYDLSNELHCALKHCNLETIKWLNSNMHGYKWSKYDIFIATFNDRFDVLKWYHSQNPEKKNSIELFKFVYMEDPDINPIPTIARWACIYPIERLFNQNISQYNSWKDDESNCIGAVKGGSLEVLQFLHKNKCPLHRTKCIITAEKYIVDYVDQKLVTPYKNIIKWINSLKDDDVIDSNVGE